jgi:hypothetical protein
VVSGRIEGDGGVPHGELLVRFADAAIRGSDTELAAARAEMVATLGRAALADAAAIVAIFSCDVRVADSTGIPLDPETAEVRQRIGARVGIERFDAAEAARERDQGSA